MKKTLPLALFALAMVGCPPGGTMPGSGGAGSTSGGESGELSSACQADFGATAAAAKLEAFLGATASFVHAANDLDGSLKANCVSMGRALGMAGGELSGGTRAVCDAVSSKLHDELTAVRAQASLRIDVVAQPPRCEISVDASASCAAQCDVDVDPGEVSVQCEGGDMVGQCSGSCSGSCQVDASAGCAGSCEGTCSAGCTGVCQGSCEGSCSATGADGQCNGRCDGTCHGSCSAGCQGSCSGECWVDAHASCQGQCRGSCSVEFTEPHCTGTVRPAHVSADCQASCDARLNAEASCEPGRVEVVVTGDVSSDLAPRLERVRAALRAGYGQLLVTGEKLRRVRQSGRAMVDAAGRLRGTGRDLGLNAVACMAEAASTVPNALAKVSVSVDIQVSVTASVSAG